MPPALFAVFLTIALLIFTGISVVLLVRPSLYMRWHPNPWMKNTPWYRIQMRVLGLVICLFVLLVLSGTLKGVSKSDLLEGFSDNILVALWVVFISAWLGGILSWVLWRFSSFRIFIRQHYSTDKIESPQWERRVTITFCGLLLCIVGSALFLAALGYHPRVKGS